LENLHNLNIEKSVLSSILFEPSIFEDVYGEIAPEAFYLPAHGHIFTAMESLSMDDMPIDEEFIKKRLLGKNQFDEEVLLSILGTNPLSNTKAYLGELKDLYNKRQLIKLTTEIKKVTLEADVSSEEALDIVQQKLYEINTDTSSKDFKDAKQITEETLAKIKANKERGNSILTGLDTGFQNLNKQTSGFGDGDLIIIAARPAMGKTALTLNLALNMLKHGNGCAFFSLEMPAEQLMMRMLAAHASIPLQKIRVGDLDDNEWGKLTTSIEFMNKSKFFADDDGQLNIHKLRSKLRELKSKHPEVKLAIIDYIQLMGGMGNKDRQLEVSEISRGIKMLARELEMPIIALSQLNRGVESRSDKRPMLSDIRESGAIEQDADIIMFVYRDAVYKAKEEREKEKKASGEGREYKSTFVEQEEEDTEIIVGKQRNGPIGTVHMKFQKRFTRFIDSNPEVETTYFQAEHSETAIPVEIETAPPINIDMPIL
jgi:replicative DNA helicase